MSGDFVKFQYVRPTCTNVKTPIEDFLATVLLPGLLYQKR